MRFPHPADDTAISPFVPIGVSATLIAMRLKDDLDNAAQAAIEGPAPADDGGLLDAVASLEARGA